MSIPNHGFFNTAIADAARQEEAEHARRTLAALMEHIPEGITIADAPNVVVRMTSKYTEKISGWSRESMAGNSQEDLLTAGLLFHADGVTPARYEELPLTRATLYGEVIENEEWVLQNPVTGEKSVMLCNAGPIRDQDDIVLGGVLVWRDITERKRMEQELRNHAIEIEMLNQRLARAMTETHHRVKNNLQVIYALVELQVAAGEEHVPVAALTRIGQHVQSLAAIHDLLTQTTRANAQTDCISTQALMAKMIPLLEATIGGRRIRSRVDDFRLPAREGSSLALLVSEIVSNAVKHGQGDIGITLAADGAQVGLTICDDGPGFPAGFDPRTAAHTGLDLISTLVAFDLRGSVRFENCPAGGAQVHVSFSLPEENSD